MLQRLCCICIGGFIISRETAVKKGEYMSLIMNIIWFLVCGFWQWLCWAAAGVLWCITIVGIPVGTQCFKFAKFAAFPFGKQIEYGGGAVSFLLNIVWVIVSGIPLALAAIANGVALCITLIGIPFGLQCFKFAKLAFMPFGSRIVSK